MAGLLMLIALQAAPVVSRAELDEMIAVCRAMMASRDVEGHVARYVRGRGDARQAGREIRIACGAYGRGGQDAASDIERAVGRRR